METIKCTKCGCEMSAMSEACPLCGTPTNKRNSDIKEDTNTLADGFHVPTPEDIEKLVATIPLLTILIKMSWIMKLYPIFIHFNLRYSQIILSVAKKLPKYYPFQVLVTMSSGTIGKH